jgi:N-acyl-phosphatidylethanolamine-hydrolysing phospholipase D
MKYLADLFQAIGRVHAPITLALLPIGSYDPRWIMSTVHTDPEGSVRIHLDLGVQKSLAVHHSTWIMSDERYDDPPKELKKQMRRLDVKEDAFVVVPLGRTLEV